jgi:Bacterial type II and III secretion system protein
MSRHLLVWVLLLPADLPAEPQDRPAAEHKRGTYVAKYAAAKDLAGILAKHFKDAAEIQTGPEGTSNCLLINAPPAVFDEIMKTLEELDRRPRSVVVEVFVVELPPKKGDDKEKRPDEKNFSGAINDVAERLEAMMKKGQVTGFKRIGLTTLEGQSTSQHLGEEKSFVSGARLIRPGFVSRTINRRSVGTMVKVTPLITADRSLTLDLDVEDTRVRASATETVGVDENSNPIPATEFPRTSLTGKISIASGKAMLAKDVKVSSKEGEAETLIIVGAGLTEAEAKAK